jgi:molybdate-binding protein
MQPPRRRSRGARVRHDSSSDSGPIGPADPDDVTPMARYHDLTAKLARRIASGELPAGAALPSMRDLAAAEATTAATVGRAYRALADAGVIAMAPRRAGRVAASGALAARSLLRGGETFRLAGSDDPALSLLVSGAPDAVRMVGATGSYRGLAAIWTGRADGASVHLRHRSGEYNAPFARGVLGGREPVLVHLWRREQGLIVPKGNPRGVDAVAELSALRVARRPSGTGTRTLLDRILLAAGVDPDAISGPTVELHLDVALAVATGEADAGLGLRSAAAPLELDFVPLSWEPFQVVTTRRQSGGVRPILDALEDPAVKERIATLGGYDLDGAGEVIEVT